MTKDELKLIQESPEFQQITKIIEDSEELTESATVMALAKALGLSELLVASNTAASVATAGSAVGAKVSGAIVGADIAVKSALTTASTVGATTVLAPFGILLGALGTSWAMYLLTKKAFQALFLKKVKTCLGMKDFAAAKMSIIALKKYKKGNKKRDDADTKLDEIKTRLLEKNC